MLKNKNLSEIGTWIHGIGSSQHTDSSGEKLIVSGIDISSIDEMTINWEHKIDHSSQIVGKVIEVKKILKESDCENEHHMYFWEKAHRVPYLYVKAVLFDKYGHNGAQDVAAMFKFSFENFNKDNQKCVLGFSIEGSKVEKDGHLIKKSIARRITATQNPCNKVCIAEYLPNPEKTTGSIKEDAIQKIMKKAEIEIVDLKKADTYMGQNKETKNSIQKPLGQETKSSLSQDNVQAKQLSEMNKPSLSTKPVEPKLKLKEKKMSNMRKAFIPKKTISRDEFDKKPKQIWEKGTRIDHNHQKQRPASEPKITNEISPEDVRKKPNDNWKVGTRIKY